ncbi:MAG: mop [Chloroflexi bacterium]|nr:mop [Chloroflexota bacterium]
MTAWINLVVNGAAVGVEVDPMRRLSAVLRDDLGLTGTKIGCDAGEGGGRRGTDDRGHGCGARRRACQRVRRSRRTPAGIPRGRGGPVRDLHAGDAHGRRRPPRARTRASRAGHPRCPRRRPLPLHGLSQDRRSSRGRWRGGCDRPVALRGTARGRRRRESTSKGRRAGARRRDCQVRRRRHAIELPRTACHSITPREGAVHDRRPRAAA